MRKVQLSFEYPLALGYSSKWIRGRFFLMHYLLGLGVLLGPFFALIAVGIVVSALFLEGWLKKPLGVNNVVFAWQRVALCALVTVIFLGMSAHGAYEVAIHWWWVSMVLAAVCFYDGYLAFRGITGLGFIKFKE